MSLDSPPRPKRDAIGRFIIHDGLLRSFEQSGSAAPINHSRMYEQVLLPNTSAITVTEELAAGEEAVAADTSSGSYNGMQTRVQERIALLPDDERRACIELCPDLEEEEGEEDEEEEGEDDEELENDEEEQVITDAPALSPKLELILEKINSSEKATAKKGFLLLYLYNKERANFDLDGFIAVAAAQEPLMNVLISCSHYKNVLNVYICIYMFVCI